MLGTELIPLTAATFAVSKMIARERIGSWVREPFVDDPIGRKRPRGGSVRRALGELVTCSRCVGAWTALGFVEPAPRTSPCGPHRDHGLRGRGLQRLRAGGLPRPVRLGRTR